MNKKRVFIINGWWDDSNSGWIPWLKKELEPRGFEVITPDMPNTERPEISAWVDCLTNAVGETDGNTYFVGHSIACQTIMRYLENLPDSGKVGGCVFVAPWFNLIEENLDDEEKTIARPWLDTLIDTGKVKNHCDNFAAIFSDNDDFVPLSDKELFERKLDARTWVEHGKGN